MRTDLVVKDRAKTAEARVQILCDTDLREKWMTAEERQILGDAVRVLREMQQR